MAGYAPATLSKNGEVLLLNTYCVYKHTSPSGKVYIGITTQKPSARWKNGFGYTSSPHFWNAIQKYGWDSFSHEILYENISCEYACFLEQTLIAEYKADNPKFGYNQKSGGQTGSSPNDEIKAKMSEKMKRFYAEHPEKRLEIAEKVRGFKHSKEAKEKMRRAKLGRTFFQTADWKKHIGEANKRRLLSDKRLYEETSKRCRENGKKSAIPVVQMDLGGNDIAFFESAKEAQRKTGAKNCNIVMCCKGLRNTANGYKWRFANTDNSGREIAL